MIGESVPQWGDESQKSLSTDAAEATTDASTHPFTFRSIDEQEKIRVSVHNFTRPLKKHRGKQLLNSTINRLDSNYMIQLLSCHVTIVASLNNDLQKLSNDYPLYGSI